jgi:hypothetical protein
LPSTVLLLTALSVSVFQWRKEQRLVLLFKIVNDLVAIPADNNIEYNQRPSRASNSKQIKVRSFIIAVTLLVRL